ncbi:MAG: ABC transporter substrate-binding protein, partial [Deltaproteobacteria bacterium]|nr:ABC transporter substrate-binding protein [Deltaproteobacteria bacterium]
FAVGRTVGASLLLASLLTVPVNTLAQAPQKVTFNMGWLPQGSMMGFAVALEQGYYAESGLAVELHRGYGGLQATNDVAQGNFHVAYGDPASVILNRSKGGRVELVGMILDRFPMGAVCRKEAGVRTPKDLEGRALSHAPGSPDTIIQPIFFRLNGVNPQAVKMVTLKPEVNISNLLEGKIDCISGWRGSTYSVVQVLARRRGREITFLPFRDWGMDIYANGIVTSDRLVAEQPDLVRRFVRASYRGYAWGGRSPEQAVELLLKRFPMLDREIVTLQWRESHEIMQGSAFRERGYGWIVEEKMARTLKTVTEAYKIQQPITTADIYTNEFLAGTP